MIGLLTRFVAELRKVGIPVSMVEAIDAGRALELVPLENRDALRHSLAACLVKSEHHLAAFDDAFNVFFTPHPSPRDETLPSDPADAGGGEPGMAGGGALDELVTSVLDALATQNRDSLLADARRAVSLLAGLQPGRPVGGRYYLHRVLGRLGVESFVGRLLESTPDADGLDRVVLEDEMRRRVAAFREMVEEEIRRKLVADRGPEAVAETTRAPLLEDIELAHAGRLEIERMERIIQPLARRLASRLAQRRRHLRNGRLDVRRTVRRSLSTGGLLADPQFRAPRVSRPDILLVCDISGSVATFAHFTMQLISAMSSQFAKVRAIAFIDGADDVTGYFAPGMDFHEAITRLTREADVVHFDGHSDYGNVLEQVLENHAHLLTPRTSVIVTGDGRSNYRPSRPELLAKISERSRALYWLNPEPRRYWGTGDSVMFDYVPLCDGVYEVRSLRQLEGFIEHLAEAAASHQTVVKV